MNRNIWALILGWLVLVPSEPKMEIKTDPELIDKMAKRRLKEIENEQKFPSKREKAKMKAKGEAMSEETNCLECQGTGWIKEDAGGGNTKKFMCEKCNGRGWIRIERDDNLEEGK